MKACIQKFQSALGASERGVLQQCLHEALQPLPKDAVPWFLSDSETPAGYLTPVHADVLRSLRQNWKPIPQGLLWDLPSSTYAARSEELGQIALELHDLGFVKGWRNEKFAFWSDDVIVFGGVCLEPTHHLPAKFEMERAAFKFFGLRSHAVHVNGFTQDGHVWCGRRSPNKSTDPGMLDNIAAGGLPVDEKVHACGIREMAEEAGISESLALTAMPLGQISTSRSVIHGWHHETLWVYNLLVPNDVHPRNQDGEVSDFTLMSPRQVVEAIAAKEMTLDAACVLAHTVLHAGSQD